MTESLRAEIRDPLWMLSRQWQVNEFRGEDAGSPARADISVEHDAVARIESAPDVDRPAASGPRDYEGGPLEAAVEREPVHGEEQGPGTRRAVEAGLHFLRLLSVEGFRDGDSTYAAEDFPDALHVDALESALPDADRRFVGLVDDRALDGAAVYDTLLEAFPNLRAGSDDDSLDWESVSPDALPLPVSEEWPPANAEEDDPTADEDESSTGNTRADAYRTAVEAYRQWYDGLYSEPDREDVAGDSHGQAWVPERMEYSVGVATGSHDNESVFVADEYTGGCLDWDSFSARDASLYDADAPKHDEATTVHQTTRLPTQVKFPGMPVPRWWEFEDADVTLTDVVADGASLPRLLTMGHVLSYGNDWFSLPLDVPVGTYSYITDLTVTDVFGVSTEPKPTTERTDDWNMFMLDPPSGAGAGVFLPPTIPDSLDGDPVERVTFTRDEMANLAFGIERQVESPTGRTFDRGEFTEPRLVVGAVHDASDPDEEFVTLSNPGDDALDISGFLVRREVAQSGSEIYEFPEFTLEAGASIRLYTGQPVETDDAATASCELESPLWSEAEAVSVYDAGAADGRTGDTTTESRSLVTRKLLGRPSHAAADYRLASDVPDHWFPFTRVAGHRLERAKLLDASTLGVPPEHLPTPIGEILNPDPELLEDTASGTHETNLRLYDEEVPSSGREVTRRDRLARWTDGTPYLWRGRRSSPGQTDESSGLRFDQLDRRTNPEGPVIPERLAIPEVHQDPPNPDRENLAEERVVFENVGTGTLDLTGWSVQDRVGHTYEFPGGFVLAAGERVTLRTGVGSDTDSDLYWGYRRSIWNNDEDTVYVYDAGERLVVSLSYGPD